VAVAAAWLPHAEIVIEKITTNITMINICFFIFTFFDIYGALRAFLLRI
jgi:hypothetical protein